MLQRVPVAATLYPPPSPQIPIYKSGISKHDKQRSGDRVELPLLIVNVADFILEQQPDAADDEVQHDEFEQTPSDVFVAAFGFDDEEYPLEQKRQVGGDQRDE